MPTARYGRVYSLKSARAFQAKIKKKSLSEYGAARRIRTQKMSEEKCRGCRKVFNENTFCADNHCDSCVSTCSCPYERSKHYAFITTRCAFCGERACKHGLLIAKANERPLLTSLYICHRHSLLQSERIKAEQALQDEVPRRLIREKRARQESPPSAATLGEGDI